MGLVGTGIFQARRDGHWVGVVSEVDPGDVSVCCWLDIFRPPRGFPADFEIVDGECHPIDRAALRPSWDRRPFVQGDPSLGHLCLDEHFKSWLHRDEILAGRRHAMAWTLGVDETALPDDVIAEDVLYWQDLGLFFDEVARLVSCPGNPQPAYFRDRTLAAVDGEVRLVFGLTY